LIIYNCQEFLGCAILNHPLPDGSYNLRLGEGRILMGIDGLPVLFIWINVDDFFVHGPSKDKLMVGVMFIMDTAVRLGLICQPIKNSPPAQIQKFCGFLYNTSSVPYLRVPVGKLSQARALVRFVLQGVVGALAKLTLTVVVGTLQSLFPETPGVMLIFRCTSKDGRPAKSARRSDREDKDMTHAYL
jgi:hypothetical protein